MAQPRTRPRPPAGDTPHVNATAAKLQPAAKPEAFVYATKASRFVTFPDPFDMEWGEAEEFLDDLARMGNSREALKRWLDDESYAALLEDRLTLRQMLTLVAMVQEHYQAFLGSLGEGQTSGS